MHSSHQHDENETATCGRPCDSGTQKLGFIKIAIQSTRHYRVGKWTLNLSIVFNFHPNRSWEKTHVRWNTPGIWWILCHIFTDSNLKCMPNFIAIWPDLSGSRDRCYKSLRGSNLRHSGPKRQFAGQKIRARRTHEN